MSGYAFTIQRPVATTMAVLAAATFGFISLGHIPLTLLPEISYPTVTVRTEYEGAGPEDVEERITRRIEEAVAVLPGLERHSSISRAGVSDVMLEFVWGTNLSFATQEIRERLDRTPLPDDAEAPLILRYDPSSDPLMRVAVFGDADLKRVRLIADETVARGLATVPGVAAVKVRGGLEEEIRVRLDSRKIASLGIDISEVDRRLKIENVNLASGTLVEGDTEYLVRTLNQFASIEEILDLAVTDRDGTPIRMRDVATVERTAMDRDVITRVDGGQSVELLVYREGDANIVELAQAVRDALFGTDEQRRLLDDVRSGRRPDPEVALKDALRKAEEEAEAKKPDGAAPGPGGPGGGHGGMGGPGGPGFMGESEEINALRTQVDDLRAARKVLAERLPAGMGLRLLSDQSVFIKDAISEVRGAAIVGGLLSVVVLLLFLKNGVATSIISVAIPLSVIVTFALLFLFDTTLNIMSLGGLALGVGMLVDNAIVVLESIFRCREEGDSRRDAAVRGTKEVGMAVAASTLTTVAVFFPIVFVEGVAGQIFGDQAVSVVCALLASLAVALFLIPMLAAYLLPESTGTARPHDRWRQPGAALARVLGPALPWRFGTTNALSNWRGLARERRLVAVLLLPVALAHLVIEIVGRLLLAAVGVAALAIKVAIAALALIVRLVGAPLQWAFDRAFGVLARAYPAALRAVLSRPFAVSATIAVTLGLGFVAWRATTTLGTEMLPTVHQGELTVHVHQKVGTPVEQAAALLQPIEAGIRALPEVVAVSAAVGVARDEVAAADEGGHSARLMVKLGHSGDAALEERAIDGIRAILDGVPEIVAYRFARPTLFSISAPIAVEARGDDLVTLRAVAADLAAALRVLPELSDVQSTVTRGKPEIHLTFDRERMRRFGLDLEAISNRIRAQVQGVVSTRFAEGDRRVDVRVLADVDSLDRLLDLTVNRGRAMDLSDTLDRGREGGGASSGTGTSRISDRTLFPGTTVDLGSGEAIPLRQVADWTIVDGPAEIRRINGQRAAVVTANTAGLDMGGAVERIHGVLDRVEAQNPEILLDVGGEGAEIGTALDGMRAALLLAIFLVYIVMAAQFESVVQPLVILLTVPLALVGAVLALSWTATPVSVVVFIGVVVLAGIVVNNAIVLVDYANQLRRRGLPVVDALVEAGSARLRPILMTTLTTVLGLLPLAGVLSGATWLGDFLPPELWRGSELQAPLAVTVIGGLLLSTILTLVIVPIVYRLVEGR